MTMRIDRRTVLKGIGGVTVGLPFLEEMLVAPAAAAAQQPAIPARAFNVFFGLGIPKPLQDEGFDDCLEPLKKLGDKLLIMRNIDHVRVDKPGINAHYDGSTGAFTAEAPVGTARSGGPSIDQMVRLAHYPDGLPTGMVPTLIAGTFFRRDRPSRYAKSFNPDGTVAASVQERPRDLFDRIFGAAPGETVDPRRDRIRRSVLDSVVEQSKYYTGENSPLGAASKARVADHLDRIREYEHRAFSAEEKPVEIIPDRPPESHLIHGGAADPGGEGIDITLDELVRGWRIMADLYAMAIQMDRVRFGSLSFLSAGERIRLTGTYEYDGRKVFEFDDSKHHGRGGAMGCSHEWWHKFRDDASNEHLRAHVHMKMREVAYFLQLLDSEDAREPNGKTILENGLFTVSTESGDGRHSDSERELSGIFHAVTGANGRFKTGQILDVDSEGIDVYNTMLDALEVPRPLGPADRPKQPVDVIRA